MKKVPVLILVLTLLASGAYVFVYLKRWEWTRALFVGMVFIVAEVALVGWLILQKLARIERRVNAARDDMSEVLDQRVLLRIRQTRPDYDRFAWLKESMSRTNVFITMVVGGGVLLSGLAWVVDKIAAKSVVPSGERALAKELHSIALPSGHLVADEASLIAQELPSCDDPDLRLLVGDTAGHRR
jgi:Prokaryotic cytochrome b561